jgi:hypothetical protein
MLPSPPAPASAGHRLGRRCALQFVDVGAQRFQHTRPESLSATHRAQRARRGGTARAGLPRTRLRSRSICATNSGVLTPCQCTTSSGYTMGKSFMRSFASASAVLGTPARRIQSQVEVGAGTPVVPRARAKHPHPLQALGGIKKTPQGLPARRAPNQRHPRRAQGPTHSRPLMPSAPAASTSSASNRRTASWRTNAATCMASASS